MGDASYQSTPTSCVGSSSCSIYWSVCLAGSILYSIQGTFTFISKYWFFEGRQQILIRIKIEKQFAKEKEIEAKSKGKAAALGPSAYGQKVKTLYIALSQNEYLWKVWMYSLGILIIGWILLVAGLGSLPLTLLTDQIMIPGVLSALSFLLFIIPFTISIVKDSKNVHMVSFVLMLCFMLSNGSFLIETGILVSKQQEFIIPFAGAFPIAVLSVLSWCFSDTGLIIKVNSPEKKRNIFLVQANWISLGLITGGLVVVVVNPESAFIRPTDIPITILAVVLSSLSLIFYANRDYFSSKQVVGWVTIVPTFFMLMGMIPLGDVISRNVMALRSCPTCTDNLG